MKDKLLILNHSFLFLCLSIYLGTGWSLILFHFQIVPDLTVNTYYLPFVIPINAATKFFITLFNIMVVNNLIMIWAEWKTKYRWYPIVLILLIISAAVFTATVFFPYNNALRQGITDSAELKQIFESWTSLHFFRNLIWTAEWMVMMAYFAHKILDKTTVTAQRPDRMPLVGSKLDSV